MAARFGLIAFALLLLVPPAAAEPDSKESQKAKQSQTSQQTQKAKQATKSKQQAQKSKQAQTAKQSKDKDPSAPTPPPAPTEDIPRAVQAADILFNTMTWYSDEFIAKRDDAARELAGRPDGIGEVTREEISVANEEINRLLKIKLKMAPETKPTPLELARQSGRPQIPGVKIVYLNPLQPWKPAYNWKFLIAHQTETPPGTAYRLAKQQFANPTKRGVQIWVETNGVAYWSVPEDIIPTQGDGGNRNDNQFIDNSETYHKVVKEFMFGIEMIGNDPDVTVPITEAQMNTWLKLVPFVQERYGITIDHIYAHKWIDIKDPRYCEGCDMAKRARNLRYVPTPREPPQEAANEAEQIAKPVQPVTPSSVSGQP